MKKIIRKILKEDRQELFLNNIILLMKDEYPIFKKLKDYGFNLSEDELNYVLSGIFGEPVIKRGKRIYNQNKKQKQIYREYSTGFWEKWTFDKNGNEVYFEDSDGFWEKNVYNKRGNKTYTEDSQGYVEYYI